MSCFLNSQLGNSCLEGGPKFWPSPGRLRKWSWSSTATNNVSKGNTWHTPTFWGRWCGIIQIPTPSLDSRAIHRCGRIEIRTWVQTDPSLALKNLKRVFVSNCYFQNFQCWEYFSFAANLKEPCARSNFNFPKQTKLNSTQKRATVSPSAL